MDYAVIRTAALWAAITLLALPGCKSHITVVRPSESDRALVGPIDIRVAHDGCGHPVPTSLSAWLDRGQPGQRDITGSFTPRDRGWTATGVPVSIGPHTLEVDAKTEGLFCAERSYSASQQTRSFAVTSRTDVSLPFETSAVLGATASTLLAVQLADGRAVSIVVPPQPAVTPPTLSLRAATVQVPGFANGRPGFELAPDGLRLLVKGEVRVAPTLGAAATPPGRLYFVRPGGKLRLLPAQAVADGAVRGGLYHASTLVAEELDAAQFADQVDVSVDLAAAGGEYGAFEEEVASALEAAALAQQLGLDERADQILDDVRDLVTARAEAAAGQAVGCGESLSQLGSLAEAAQLVGVPDDVDAALVARFAQEAQECVRGGTLETVTEVMVPGQPDGRMKCTPAIPFVRFDEGKLRGSGTTHCVLHWVLTDQGMTMILDADLSQRLRLKGTVEPLAARFDPPTSSDESGSMRASGSQGGEPPVTVIEITLTPGQGQVDVNFIPAETILRFTASRPAETTWPRSLSFALGDGAVDRRVTYSEGITAVETWTLHLDVDDCGKAKIEEQCRAEREELVRACASLQDWMVVSHIGAGSGAQVTCASSDCAEVIHRNESNGRDPFTSIVKTLDKACDDQSPVVCSLECYGWAP